ncbi:hypothetical protein, partial [Enterococcus larvae]|uniref:hypothetical protein n=1 Tax=Enterococcus larvae TaxID=2794352 RepID=UPI003F672AC1
TATLSGDFVLDERSKCESWWLTKDSPGGTRHHNNFMHNQRLASAGLCYFQAPGNLIFVLLLNQPESLESTYWETRLKAKLIAEDVLFRKGKLLKHI